MSACRPVAPVRDGEAAGGGAVGAVDDERGRGLAGLVPDLGRGHEAAAAHEEDAVGHRRQPVGLAGDRRRAVERQVDATVAAHVGPGDELLERRRRPFGAPVVDPWVAHHDRTQLEVAVVVVVVLVVADDVDDDIHGAALVEHVDLAVGRQIDGDGVGGRRLPGGPVEVRRVRQRGVGGEHAQEAVAGRCRDRDVGVDREGAGRGWCSCRSCRAL